MFKLGLPGCAAGARAVHLLKPSGLVAVRAALLAAGIGSSPTPRPTWWATRDPEATSIAVRWTGSSAYIGTPTLVDGFGFSGFSQPIDSVSVSGVSNITVVGFGVNAGLVWINISDRFNGTAALTLDIVFQPVPEPAAGWLLGAGVLTLAGVVRNRQSGEALVESLAVQPAMRVLDLGCGDGTTAVPLAQRGAEVLGIDIARNLVAAGQRRAAALGLGSLHFQHGDACDLHGVDDQTFDLAVSMFGAMFAPKPFDVARHLVRVVKPGGRIVMGKESPTTPPPSCRNC